MEILSNEYIEKLYFFALKKTGDENEAEELSQEVIAQVLMGLSKGIKPNDFSGWFWAIARNHYSKWVDKKVKARQRYCSDESALELISDSSISAEEKVIYEEDIALLKRELSLLSSNYRNITVEYYIKGEKISNISKKLNLSEGTVKRRLYESRKNLKEGMKMARENGRRSYLAEEVRFSMCGNTSNGSNPWECIARRIPKNIVLEAYKNPRTLEELCMEMGIAMPYMEEEVDLLVKCTLLTEIKKGVFQSDFIILDKDMQKDIVDNYISVKEKFSKDLLTLLDTNIDEVKNIEFLGNNKPNNELYWTLIPYVIDILLYNYWRNNKINIEWKDRPNGAKWNFTGYEICNIPKFFTSNNWFDKLSTYSIFIDDRIKKEKHWNEIEIKVMTSIIKDNVKLSDLNDREEFLIKSLADQGLLKIENDVIVPQLIIFTSDKLKLIIDILKKDGIWLKLIKEIDSLYKFNFNRIGSDVPAILHDQVQYVAATELFDLRKLVTTYALDNGYLEIPEDIERSTIGMYLTI